MKDDDVMIGVFKYAQFRVLKQYFSISVACRRNCKQFKTLVGFGIWERIRFKTKRVKMRECRLL